MEPSLLFTCATELQFLHGSVTRQHGQQQQDAEIERGNCAGDLSISERLKPSV